MVGVKDVWQVQEAKARFTELLRQAESAPQTITRHGERVAVMLSNKEYDRLRGLRQGSIVDYFAHFDLGDVEIPERERDAKDREVDLS